MSDIDLHLLRNSIDRLPVEEIKERRRNFNILYEEAMLSADNRGISFTRMLLMLAHYKFIDDNKALRYESLKFWTDGSLDEFLRRRAKLVRVTDAVSEKICRGFFQTLYWRRQFLAHYNSTSSSTGGFTGVGMFFAECELTIVPSIVVEESESAGPEISNPRLALPSLDLTYMRGNTGAGYSPEVSPTHIPVRDRSQGLHSPQSSPEESPWPIRTWTSLGAPDSQIAMSTGSSELYSLLRGPQANFRSQPMDENEANQVVRSLNQSAWGGAIRGSPSRSQHSRTGSDRSA